MPHTCAPDSMMSNMLCTADAGMLALTAVDTGVDYPELVEDQHENNNQKGHGETQNCEQEAQADDICFPIASRMSCTQYLHFYSLFGR